MIHKNVLIEEIKNEQQKDKIQQLQNKIDRLEEYLDKIYSCVSLKDKKEYGNIEYLPQHNLKKREINQKFEDFRMDIFSEELIVDESGINSLEQMDSNIHAAEVFITNFDKDDMYNLLFIGNTGTGKTFLSNHIANALIQDGYTVRKYSSVELFDFINEALLIDRKINLAEYKMLIECDLLILDDLGNESITSFTKGHLFNILNSRHAKCKKTLICSNLSLIDISRKYEEKIFSRIADDYYICKFTGEDLRLKVLKRRSYIK